MFHNAFLQSLAVFAPSLVWASETIELCRAVVILIVLTAALYVILSRKYPPKVEHWAYTTIGVIIGLLFGR
ncbi:MAG TPA: hypothetical protein VJ723_09420 [Candidatus Angelobacter sp.]|nr:hypothetical protein [Candidatus Angelobacter sp.]